MAWQVSLYMGAQSTIFYTLASWYAPYEIANGVSAAMAGAELMIFQALGIAGSLLLPLAGRSLRLRRWLPALLPMIGLFAWFGIPLAPQAMFAWIVIGGLTGGAQLTMSMTLMATRARTADHSTALSGMAQAVG
ncbi:MAG: MFS transporter [Microbacteriaceae bacterium]|nr:MFS transporter [Microbacteriaceae bacterium]